MSFGRVYTWLKIDQCLQSTTINRLYYFLGTFVNNFHRFVCTRGYDNRKECENSCRVGFGERSVFMQRKGSTEGNCFDSQINKCCPTKVLLYWGRVNSLKHNFIKRLYDLFRPTVILCVLTFLQNPSFAYK